MAKYKITSDTEDIVIKPQYDQYYDVSSIDFSGMKVTVEWEQYDTPQPVYLNKERTESSGTIDYNPTRKFGGYVTDDTLYWNEDDLRWKGTEIENTAITSFDGSSFSLSNDDWGYLLPFCPHLEKVDFGTNTSQVTNAHSLCYKCSSITEWENMRFPNCLNMGEAFYGNVNLTNFDVSKVCPKAENVIKMLGYTRLKNVDLSAIHPKRLDYVLIGCCFLEDAVVDLSECESMSHAFIGCESLTGLTFKNDVGKVKDIQNIFYGQSDGGYWKNEFGGDSNQMNSPRVKEFKLNGSSLESISMAFGNDVGNDHNGNEKSCPIEVVNFNNGNDSLPNLKNVTHAFKLCRNLRDVTIKNVDGVKEFGNLFSPECVSLERVALGTWKCSDGSVMNASSLFSNRPKLRELDFKCPNKLNMSRFFAGSPAMTGWDFSNTPNATNTSNMFSGCTGITVCNMPDMPYLVDSSNMFVGCSNLTEFSIGKSESLSGVGTMFSGCTSLTSVTMDGPKSISNIFNGNSSVKYVNFGDCTSLTAVSSFQNSGALETLVMNNCVNLPKISDMLKGCTALTSVTINGLDNCLYASTTFSGCSSLSALSLSMPKVTNANSMLLNCSSLKSVELSMPLITSVSNIFSGCTALETADLGEFKELTKADNLMKGCSALTSITIGDMGKCTSTQNLFSGCSKLKDVQLGTMRKVTNATNMFVGCSSLTEFNQDCSELVTTAKMFSGCTNLTGVTLSGIRKFGTDMFSGCTKLEVVDFGECPYLSGGGFTNNTVIKRVTMRNCSIFSGMSNGFRGCTNLEYVDFGDGFPMMSAMTAMFSGCSKIKEINMGSCPSVGKPSYNASGIPSYNGANQMFSMCGSLTSVTMTDLENISNTSDMFKGCSSLTSVNLGNVPNLGTVYIKDLSGNVGNASVSNMFSGCSSLSSVTFNGADNMVNAQGLFNGCSGLTSFSISGFALLNNTTSMFSNCVSLTSVDLGYCPTMGAVYTNASGKTASPTFSKMFSGCTALESVKIEMPNCTAITNNDMFVNCRSLKSVDFGSCPNMVNIGAIFVSTNTSLESITINDCEGISAKTMFGATLTSVTDIYMSGLSKTAQASIVSKNKAKVPNATWHF